MMSPCSIHEVPRTTDEQGLALARVLNSRNGNATIARAPFDLPRGYLLVTFTDGYQCGVAPDGRVST